MHTIKPFSERDGGALVSLLAIADRVILKRFHSGETIRREFIASSNIGIKLSERDKITVARRSEKISIREPVARIAMVVSDKDRPQKSTGMREYVGWFCFAFEI